MRLRSEVGGDAGVDAIEPARPAGRIPGVVIGGGRVAVGAAFFANPTASVRFLGLDTATANRISWLARMTAARDIALGVGTVTSAIGGRGSSGWLLAGAACDIADGVALADALARKRVAPLAAAAVIATTIAASAVAIAAAVRRPSSDVE